MADRHLPSDTPEQRAPWGNYAFRSLKIAVAIPVVVLMIGFAKAAQSAAVGAFGDELGFNLASLVGGGPVIAIYYWAAIKLPKFNTFGLSRG
jgi:hypothetical protein